MNLYFASTVDAVGWTLLHFLWQGTVVALLAAGVLQLLQKNSSQSRYLVAGLAFLVMLASFGVTLSYHWESRPTLGEVGEELVLPDPVPAMSEAVSEPANVVTAVVERPLFLEGSPLPPVVVGESRPAVVVESPEVPEEASLGEGVSVEKVETVLPWVVYLWLTGVLLCSVRLLFGWARVRSWLRSGVVMEDAGLRGRFAELAAALRVSRPVRLLCSRTVAVPVVVGWLKPTILIPARLWTGLPIEQLEAILAHELAHIRRHDFLVNLLQNLAETIFFFHPAVWWISAQLRKEREHCCDDIASAQCGGAVDYVRALAALEELRAAPFPAVAATGGSLIDRVRRLVGVRPSGTRPALSLVAGLAASIAIVSLVAMGKPAPPKADSAEEGLKEQLVWATKEGGEWTLAGGVKLKLIAGPFGSNEQSTAILEWPAEEGQVGRNTRIPVAGHWYEFSSNSQVNAHPWALAWEKDRSVLWIATGQMGHWKTRELAYREGATGITRVSFGDRERVDLERFSGWEALGHKQPSKECRAKLDHLLKVPVEGVFLGRAIQWANSNPPGRMTGGLEVLITIHDDTGACNLGRFQSLKERMDLKELSQLLPAEAKRVEDEWKEWVGKLQPEQRALLDKSVRASAMIEVRPEVGEDIVEEVISLCRAAGVVPEIAATAKADSENDGREVGKPLPVAGRQIAWAPANEAGLSLGYIELDPDASYPQGQQLPLVFYIRNQGKETVKLSASGAGNLSLSGSLQVSKNLWHKPYKFEDLKGAYRVAGVTGTGKLWVVDEAGLRLLDLSRSFAVEGQWPLDRLGDVPGMSKEIRQALGLDGDPGTAKSERDAAPGDVPVANPGDARVIRGLDLKDVPFKENVPASREGKIFEMSVNAKGGKPIMVYPLGKPHFYLEFEGRTYGPVKGNPFVKLKLAEVLRAQLEGMPEEERNSRYWEIFRCEGDEPLMAVGYEVVMKFDKDPGRTARVAMDGALKLFPLAATVSAGRRALKHANDLFYAGIHDAAKAKWEAARVKVADNAYRRGSPMAEAPKGIVWNKPNEVGLQLGVLGVPTKKPHVIGNMLPLRFFLRNDRLELVKCNPSGLWGVGVELVLSDEAGNKFTMHELHAGRGGEPRVALGGGRFYECQFQPVQTIALKPDGQWATNPFENCSVALRPGRYQVDLKYSMGVFDVTCDWHGPDRWGNGARAEGEWNGTLQAAPMEAVFGAPQVTAVKIGSTIRYFDLHQLQFEKDRVTLSHRINWPVRMRNVGEKYNDETGEWEGTPWGELADRWKSTGDYRAAVDKGSARLWTVDEAGIHFLEFHEKFLVHGQWKMAEAAGELGGMPVGIRQALKLPAKANPREGDPADLKGNRLPAYAPDKGSAKYLNFRKAVRESHKLKEGDPDPINWGKAQGGLQAGLIMPATVRQAGKVSGWMLIRNVSDEVKELKVVYSWNTMKLLAVDGGGKELGSADFFMQLRGVDAILPATLKPGEHLEFETYAITISPDRNAQPPLVKIDPRTKVAKLHFDLSSVLGGNAGIRNITTGVAEIRIEPHLAAVREKENEVARQGVFEPVRGDTPLSPTVNLFLESTRDGIGLPRTSAKLQWHDGEGKVTATSELGLPLYAKVPPMFLLGNALWIEETPVFGSGFHGLRQLDFSEPGALQGRAWTAGELRGAGNRARGIPAEITTWLERERAAPVAEGFSIRQAAKNDGTDFSKVVLKAAHVKSARRWEKAGERQVHLQLSAEGKRELQRALKEAPEQSLKLSVEGDLLSTGIVRTLKDDLHLTGAFDKRTIKFVASYLGRITLGKADPQHVADILTPATEIPRAGGYKIGDFVVTVTETKDGEFIRNEVQVSHRGADGKETSGRWALPYGANSWAILAARRDYFGQDTLSLAIASSKKELEVRLIPGKGLEHAAWAYVSRYRVPEMWVRWVARVKPTLDAERKPELPAFELRLEAMGNEKVEMACRRSATRNTRVGHRGFVALGERLLSAQDVIQVATVGGILQVYFEVKEDSLPKFHALCEKYKGRTVALIQDGEISSSFKLTPGLKNITSLKPSRNLKE